MATKRRVSPPIRPDLQIDDDFVFRPWITLRDGGRSYAKDRGLKAFKIPRRY